MRNRDRYPDNWEEIALQVKEKAEWTCQRCGLECFPPNYQDIYLGFSFVQ